MLLFILQMFCLFLGILVLISFYSPCALFRFIFTLIFIIVFVFLIVVYLILLKSYCTWKFDLCLILFRRFFSCRSCWFSFRRWVYRGRWLYTPHTSEWRKELSKKNLIKKCKLLKMWTNLGRGGKLCKSQN